MAGYSEMTDAVLAMRLELAEQVRGELSKAGCPWGPTPRAVLVESSSRWMETIRPAGYSFAGSRLLTWVNRPPTRSVRGGSIIRCCTLSCGVGGNVRGDDRDPALSRRGGCRGRRTSWWPFDNPDSPRASEHSREIGRRTRLATDRDRRCQGETTVRPQMLTLMPPRGSIRGRMRRICFQIRCCDRCERLNLDSGGKSVLALGEGARTYRCRGVQPQEVPGHWAQHRAMGLLAPKGRAVRHRTRGDDQLPAQLAQMGDLAAPRHWVHYLTSPTRPPPVEQL